MSHGYEDSKVLYNKGFIFHELLMTGSFGKVWLCSYSSTYDRVKAQRLACKVIDQRSLDGNYNRKFLPRELYILSKVNHPHVIHLHSIYQRKQKIFVFMRLAEKGDLLEYLMTNGAVQESVARQWTCQIVVALQYLHLLDIVHRDIKCDNILVTEKNNVKLADFGLSRFMIEASTTKKSNLSKTFCGSFAYLAPEVLHGERYDPKRSDVWSVGVVLFVMLNKYLPFGDKNIGLLLENQISCKWRFRTAVKKTLSEDAIAMVMEILRPNPNERPTADELLEYPWFKYKQLPHEKQALDHAKTNKFRIVPYGMKLRIPDWSKRPKNVDLVCLTDMKDEQSSLQPEISFSSDSIVRSKESEDDPQQATADPFTATTSWKENILPPPNFIADTVEMITRSSDDPPNTQDFHL